MSDRPISIDFAKTVRTCEQSRDWHVATFIHRDGRQWIARTSPDASEFFPSLTFLNDQTPWYLTLYTQGVQPVYYLAASLAEARRVTEAFANMPADWYARLVAAAHSTLDHPQVGEVVFVTIAGVTQRGRQDPQGDTIRLYPTTAQRYQVLLQTCQHCAATVYDTHRSRVAADVLMDVPPRNGRVAHLNSMTLQALTLLESGLHSLSHQLVAPEAPVEPSAAVEETRQLAITSTQEDYEQFGTPEQAERLFRNHTRLRQSATNADMHELPHRDTRLIILEGTDDVANEHQSST